VVTHLLSAGASADAAAADGRTPLHFLVADDSEGAPPLAEARRAVARVLIAARADVEALHGGLTPLLVAAAAGHTATLDELVRGGASLHARAANGSSVLLAAVSGGHLEAAAKLVELGARGDPEALDAARARMDARLIQLVDLSLAREEL